MDCAWVLPIGSEDNGVDGESEVVGFGEGGCSSSLARNGGWSEGVGEDGSQSIWWILNSPFNPYTFTQTLF